MDNMYMASEYYIYNKIKIETGGVTQRLEKR